jgi:hypothetical protein
MLSFEVIIDKIAVFKKLKSFTEEIFKKLSKNLQIGLVKIALLPWQRGFLTTFFIFRNSRCCSSYMAKFRDHTLQDDKIMVF